MNEIRDAIVATLKSAGLGESAAAHDGRLNVEELLRLVPRGRNSVLVSCLGLSRVERVSAGVEVDLSLAAYVIALDQAGSARDVVAMQLAAAVATLVAGNLWGRDDLNDPQQIRADNLYSGQLDKRGVALWAVSWRQTWTTGQTDPSTLDDLLRVAATYDLDTTGDGEPTVTDTITLEGGS